MMKIFPPIIILLVEEDIIFDGYFVSKVWHVLSRFKT